MATKDNSGTVSVTDDHKALISILMLVGMAFLAAGVAGHSPGAGKVILLILVGVTFLLTLSTGLYGNSTIQKDVESYPWTPTGGN